MRPLLHVIRLGVDRGITQFVQVFTSRDGFVNTIFFNSIPLVVFVLLRDEVVGDTDVSVALYAMPGMLASLIVFGAVLNAAYYLSFEREDGTLLRLKALPAGMAGYVTGRVVQDSLDTLVGFGIVLVGGFIVVPGLGFESPLGFVLFVAFVVLGLLATIPLGLIVGSLLRNPRFVFSIGVLILVGLMVISGIWFPVQDLPEWLGAFAQLLPMCWLGVGMRSVLLPDAAAAVEVTGAWRTGEAMVVLAVWAAGGLFIATRLLRRMAARESGSAVEGAREKALQRG